MKKNQKYMKKMKNMKKKKKKISKKIVYAKTINMFQKTIFVQIIVLQLIFINMKLKTIIIFVKLNVQKNFPLK